MRGVGFEPTEAYATGFRIPRRILSLTRPFGESTCPFDLNPALLLRSGSREPPLAFSTMRVLL